MLLQCQSCKETINKGDRRVSFPGRHAGITVVKWLHPQCFAETGIAVDYAPTGRAKCCDTGREIGKGEARLVMRLMGCDGQPKGAKIFHPASGAATAFLGELFEHTEGVTHATLASQLPGPAEHRAWVADALRGNNPAAPVPVADTAPALKKRKPKAAAEEEPEPLGDTAPKAKRQAKAQKREAAEPEREDSDGELVD